MITSEQIRASRTFLRMPSEELAQKASIGVATIKRIEAGDGIPACNAKTLAAIQKALEESGIEFLGTPTNSPGLRYIGIVKTK